VIGDVGVGRGGTGALSCGSSGMRSASSQERAISEGVYEESDCSSHALSVPELLLKELLVGEDMRGGSRSRVPAWAMESTRSFTASMVLVSNPSVGNGVSARGNDGWAVKSGYRKENSGRVGGTMGGGMVRGDGGRLGTSGLGLEPGGRKASAGHG
jgi:hypothetical protein